MCGIAGWIGKLQHEPDLVQVLERALHHRGPDAHGHQTWPEATLVHTRLSILDLSPSGSQPMSNEDGTVWTVYNGEIYNYADLRRDLEAKGHRFQGRADTEVLPHLYEEYGTDFVHRLRGMFAFAVYDVRKKKLMLARDRFGIKPVFFAPGHERVAFASELNALRMIPGIDLRPNRQAVYDFAALFYIPAPATFYSGILALEPGQLLEAQWVGGRVDWTLRSFHRWALAPDQGLTLPQAAKRTDELIDTAVKKQLESDVPLGCLLSGGIDSSLVSSAAQRCAGGLRTFNVRFSDADYDETWAAEAVARHIQSEHQTLAFQDTTGTWDGITSLLRHAGQPFGDTSLFAVNAVCRLMRRHVTVALSGDGGDEGFGGYDIHRRSALVARCQVFPPLFWRGAAMGLRLPGWLGLIPPRLVQRFHELAGADDATIVQRLSCWTRQHEHRRFCRDENLLPVRRHFEPQWDHSMPRSAGRVERVSALATEVDFRLTLPNDFLFKVDTASMRESMEVRVPMLDEDLVEFGLTLPYALKVRGRTGKRVLRAVAGHRLPAAVAAKKKWGFGIPIDRWVDDDFRDGLNTLAVNGSPLNEFFRPETYRPWIDAFRRGRSHPEVSRVGLYQRAILLLAVHEALTRKD